MIRHTKQINGMDGWGLLWLAFVGYVAYSTPTTAWEYGAIEKTVHVSALLIGGFAVWWVGRRMVQEQA